MLYLKSASLACVATLTAMAVFHATAFAEPDRSGMLAQYEDVGQQNLEFAPAVLMPAAEAELLDQQFTVQIRATFGIASAKALPSRS